MPEGKVAILFLEVARRSPWCRGTPAHVHWSLLRCPRSSGFSFVSPKRQRETYPSLPVLLFSSPYATDSPTSGPRLPHLGELDHLPFCARRTLWPPSPRQKRRSPSRPLLSTALPPTRPLPLSSSPPVLFHLQRQRSHPSHRRAILSLRFTRDLSAFINYIAAERCVSLLPALAAASAIAKPHSQLRSAPGFSPPRDAPRHTLVNQRRWF